ncbi:MAG: ribulose-phosphate 3-epimerase [Fibrobacteria bacterium]|jgi:ribulose-phosphate 3-epimerase|nr:ribulose-phosphate 3-epimerase [Fibrobacteria bacterium]
MTPPRKLAPSILNSDFSRLGEAIQAVTAGGADWVHLDVMDGHFVPNLTIGPIIVEAAKKNTTLPLDCHLMVSNPETMVPWFTDAGADSITVHAEATRDLPALVRLIKSKGARAGVSIKPDTPVEALYDVLPELDMVLLMSVFPGFGGQKFIPESLDRARRLRAHSDELGLNLDIEMDGGIGLSNLGEVLASGVNAVVVGTAIFRQPDVAGATRAFKAAMG